MNQQPLPHELKSQDELIARLERELRATQQQVAEKDQQIKALMLRMNQALDHHIQRRYTHLVAFCRKSWGVLLDFCLRRPRP